MEKQSHQERDFNLVAKVLLGLSMITTGMTIFSSMLKFGYIEYANVTVASLIIEIVLDVLILIAGFAVFLKHRWGLIALTALFVIRMFATIPLDSTMYSYQLGGNMVHFFRDFGLFAIAMCFKKNGVSGWKSILASDKSSEEIDEESHEESEIRTGNEEKQGGVAEEDKNPIVDENTEDCIMEENAQIEKDKTQECLSNEKASSMCMHSSKAIVKNQKPTKLRIWGTIALVFLVGIASLYIYVNSQDYPKYVTRFGDKFKYCLSIPNNKLAKECVANSQKALDEGFVELSIEYTATASEVNPNKSTIMYDIADSYFDIAYETKNDSYYKESETILIELLKVAPGHIMALEELAAIYNNLGNVEESYKIAEQILFNDSDNEQGLYFMCHKFYKKKEWNSLEKWGKRGYNLENKENRNSFTTTGCIYFYAKALYETGNRFDAMRIYAEAENIDPLHWLHAEFEELGGIPCSILSLSVGNEGKDGTVIDKPGETIYSVNTCYLIPYVKVKSERSGTFNFDVKLYENGSLRRNSTRSPIGYSYSSKVKISGLEGQIIEVGGWGSDQPGHWDRGNYRFEIWWKGNKLYSQSFKIY